MLEPKRLNERQLKLDKNISEAIAGSSRYLKYTDKELINLVTKDVKAGKESGMQFMTASKIWVNIHYIKKYKGHFELLFQLRCYYEDYSSDTVRFLIHPMDRSKDCYENYLLRFASVNHDILNINSLTSDKFDDLKERFSMCRKEDDNTVFAFLIDA